MKLAEILKELREEQGISQFTLSALTGISHSTIARWELDQCEPTASGLIKLANFFNLSVDDLLGREESTCFENASVQKTEIQSIFDSLSPIQQENLLNYARGMAVSNQLDKKEQINKKRA